MRDAKTPRDTSKSNSFVSSFSFSLKTTITKKMSIKIIIIIIIMKCYYKF